jgi:hypothetical protein
VYAPRAQMAAAPPAAALTPEDMELMMMGIAQRPAAVMIFERF